MQLERGIGSSEANQQYLERAKELASQGREGAWVSDLLGQPFKDAYPEWGIAKIEYLYHDDEDDAVTVNLYLRRPDRTIRLISGRGVDPGEAIVHALMGEAVDL